MAEPFDDLIGLTNPRSTYNPTGGVVQLPGQGGAPGPYTVDPGAAMSSYLEAFSPELMNRILELERSYAPQFSELDIAARNRNLASFTDLIGTLTNTAGDVARGEARAQSQAEIDRMAQFGGPTIAAYIAANPYLQSAMSRSDALGGVSTNAAYDALSRSLLGGAPSAINLTAQQVTPGTLASGGTLTPQQVTADQLASMGTLTPQQVSAMMMGPMAAISPERVSASLLGSVGQLTPERVEAERVAAERIAAERIAAGQVQAGEVGAGALGQSLYQQALRSQQLSPLSQALQAQGLGMAMAPGQITAEEARAATQGARERFAASGRLEDISAITGEALARAGASRERQMQDIAAAQQINAQLLGAQQAGQSLATDVLRADIARQQANVATGLQAGTFNVEAALRAAQANQQTGLQASQANQDAMLRAALANQQTGLQAALANQQAGMEAGRFNIGNELAIAQANMAAQNQFALANQQAGLSAAEINARNQLAVQQANQAAANQFALANQQAGMQAGQFNISNATDLARLNQASNLQAALANQQAGMQAGQFNIQNLQDIGRFNIGNQLQSGMFNAEAANRMAEANRGFNYTAQQDYLRNLGLLGQSTQGLREADRAYNLNQLGAYGNVSGAGLQAAGYGQQAPGVAQAMNYFQLGSQVAPSQRFDPNAGINLASTNAANLSNYYGNVYAADQARQGAQSAASATRSAGAMSAVGSLGGAAIIGFAL